jgi:hypothetical protein
VLISSDATAIFWLVYLRHLERTVTRARGAFTEYVPMVHPSHFTHVTDTFRPGTLSKDENHQLIQMDQALNRDGLGARMSRRSQLSRSALKALWICPAVCALGVFVFLRLVLHYGSGEWDAIPWYKYLPLVDGGFIAGLMAAVRLVTRPQLPL